MSKGKIPNDCMSERYHVYVYNSLGRVIDKFDFVKPICTCQSVYNFIEVKYLRIYGYVPHFDRVEIKAF